MKKVKNGILFSLFVIMSITSLIALVTDVEFECSDKDLLLYRIGSCGLLVFYAIGFLVEFCISKFTNGIKKSPVKKRLILWSSISIVSIVIFLFCFGFTSNEFKFYLQENSNTVLPVNEPEKESKAETAEKQKLEQNLSDKKSNDVILGSTETEVRKLLHRYREEQSPFEDELYFENEDLLITVYLTYSDKQNTKIAEGVTFESCNYQNINPITMEGAYVSTHYDELVALSTNDENVLIETDLTKYNSSGAKKAASQLYIGNVPH